MKIFFTKDHVRSRINGFRETITAITNANFVVGQFN